MAIYLDQIGHQVTLQCYLQSEYDHLKKTGFAPNLPNFKCSEKIQFEKELNDSHKNAEVLVISTPVAFLRGVLSKIEGLSKETVIVTINKGIERESMKTVPEIIKEYFPDQPVAHLGGPCFPEGLLSEKTPAAETLACEDREVGVKLQSMFASEGFRVYLSTDLLGVAMMGALKNVYAIAAGIAEGIGLYEEVTAVLVTRGLAEMKRICLALGVSVETLYGLSGLGDLALTCYSPKSSHNKTFGLRLGKGESVKTILDNMHGQVAEGYYTTKAVWDLSQKHEIDLPLCQMIYQVLYEEMPLKQAIKSLMNRPLKLED